MMVFTLFSTVPDVELCSTVEVVCMITGSHFFFPYLSVFSLLSSSLKIFPSPFLPPTHIHTPSPCVYVSVKRKYDLLAL